MLRPIIGDLGLVLPDGLDDAAWIVNAYLIAFVAVMPIAGRVSDVLGRRRTFVGAYLLFLVGTIADPAVDPVRRAVPLVPRRPHPHRDRRRRDGAGRARRRRRRVSRRAGAPVRSARSARSRRWAGCGGRCTARCSCASCRGSGSSGSTSRSRSAGSPRRGGRSPATTGPTERRRDRLDRRGLAHHRARRAQRGVARRRPRSRASTDSTSSPAAAAPTCGGCTRSRRWRPGLFVVQQSYSRAPAVRPAASSAAATC